MANSFQTIDRFAARLTRGVIRWRWLVILVAIVGALAVGSGAQHLEFANNYRVFFSDENPELTAFEDLQATYTKNDNFLFVLEPSDGDAFSANTLTAVESLTDAAWQIPYAIRVDSISNFQHSYGVEDDLIVEDLFRDAAQMDADERARRGEVALAEPLLRNQLVTSKGSVTAVNVVLQYPEQSLTEVPEAVAYARGLRDQIEAQHPDSDERTAVIEAVAAGPPMSGDERHEIPVLHIPRYAVDALRVEVGVDGRAALEHDLVHAGHLITRRRRAQPGYRRIPAHWRMPRHLGGPRDRARGP